MTYEEIVATAKKELSKCDVSDYKGHLAVQVDVTGEGAGSFYIKFNDGTVDIQPYDYRDNDCKLIASADTLNGIISGKKDAVAAFMTGKLKVQGSIDKALEFQKLINGKTKKK